MILKKHWQSLIKSTRPSGSERTHVLNTEVPRQVVLVVDDAPENIQVLSAILKPCYKVKAATTGAKALQIAGKAPPPDMILQIGRAHV